MLNGGTLLHVRSTESAAVLLRWRYAVLGVWSAVWATALARRWDPHDLGFNDWTVFQFAGRILTGQDGYDGGPGGPLHLYANLPKVQIGPPALYASLPIDALGPTAGTYAAVVVMSALGLLFLFVAERLGQALAPDRRPDRVLLLGGLLFVPAWAVIAASALHLDDALVLVATAAAMLAVAHGRWVPAGALLGLALATKPWAVFLLPVLWGLSRTRRPAAFLVVLGVAAAFWAPFVLVAPDTVSALGGVRLFVAPDSGLRLLGVAVDEAPTWARALQLLVAVGAAALVAVRGHWVAVPLAGVAVRVALDPQTHLYYGAGLVAAALLVDLASRRTWPVLTVAASVVVYLPLLVDGPAPVLAGALRLIGCAGLVAVAVRPGLVDVLLRRSPVPASTP